MPGSADVHARVLLVEDDAVGRTVLATSLRETGHVVAEAASCAEALSWTRTWPPDVVLLDRFLPDGDGLDLLVQLSDDPVTSDIPVVMVTGTPEKEFVVEALRAGAHDYVAKPFLHEEVLARLESALRTKALVDELRVLAGHDVLTGLRNRRGVAEQLVTWRAHCTRHGVPLTVSMLDVNDFKQVNEQHSHAAGDRVLRAVAEQLVASVRADDVVARWGGDEFLVLLPRADASTATAMLERVNRRLATQRLLPDRTITLRAGVAVAAPGDLEDDAELLGRAAASLLEERHTVRLPA